MPPARTIFVDKDTILASIFQSAATHHAETLRRLQDGWDNEEYRRDEIERAQWVVRDLEFLARKPLTPSERKRHQEAMRELEAAGFIVMDARWVKLTPAGHSALARKWGAEERADTEAVTDA